QDQQVKVRGLRIELEEIEAVLLRYPGIREAIVLVHEKTRLIAYLTLKEQEEVPEVDLLRYFLKQYLPDYMLPATFTVLPQLPLTPNNKIDRSLLLKQAGDQFQRSAATFVPPSTEIERTIAAVWQKALGLERIGRHENFFDLGGHSLLAVEVIQKLQQELNCQI